jgi:hypothetical protein
VPELAVPVGMLLALQGFGVALQAEALLAQHVADNVGGDPPALAGQLGREVTGGLRGPPQRRHRIAPQIRLHQRRQRRPQTRVEINNALAPTTGSAYSPQRCRTGVQFADPQRHRGLAHISGTGDQPDPTMADHPGFRPHQQPPLPLIQMRKDHLELGRQRRLCPLHHAHTTSMTAKIRTYGLFLGAP